LVRTQLTPSISVQAGPLPAPADGSAPVRDEAILVRGEMT
jgi:hypothetical protein